MVDTEWKTQGMQTVVLAVLSMPLFPSPIGQLSAKGWKLPTTSTLRFETSFEVTYVILTIDGKTE